MDYFVTSFDPEGRYAGVFMNGSWAVCDLVEERLDAETFQVVKENAWQQMGVEVPTS